MQRSRGNLTFETGVVGVFQQNTTIWDVGHFLSLYINNKDDKDMSSI